MELVTETIERHIAEGYIRSVDHPSGQLRILNYTPKTQYEGKWDAATLMCRGLIVDKDWNIIARPFPKFFNWGELDGAEQAQLLHRPPISITDKLDGSLGIIYMDPDGDAAVATRGSFTSDQAQWATKWLRERMPNIVWHKSSTILTEIIYPENRIVVDYDFEGLVYLDTLDNLLANSADWHGHEEMWVDMGGRVVEKFPESLLEEILAGGGPLPDDGNHEGYVATWSSGGRVKLKLAEYVRLHRIVTGVNSRHIWERLRDGEGLDEILDRVPDEFNQWVRETEASIKRSYFDLLEEIDWHWDRVIGAAGKEDRKAFALEATKSKLAPALFARLDKNLDKEEAFIWKMIQPPTEVPFRGEGEW